MIWAVLAFIGVPLWLCAAGIFTLIFRNRALRHRPGNVPVRVHPPGKKRWSPGHGVWVHDVFAFRGFPAAWKEALVWPTEAAVRAPTSKERKQLHRIGHDPVVVTLLLAEGGPIEIAARAEAKDNLLGPFAHAEHRPSVSAVMGGVGDALSVSPRSMSSSRIDLDAEHGKKASARENGSA